MGSIDASLRVLPEPRGFVPASTSCHSSLAALQDSAEITRRSCKLRNRVLRVRGSRYYSELFIQAFNGLAKLARPLRTRLTRHQIYATATGVSTRVPDAESLFLIFESNLLHHYHFMILVR